MWSGVGSIPSPSFTQWKGGGYLWSLSHKGTNPVPKGCTLMTQSPPQGPTPNTIILGVLGFQHTNLRTHKHSGSSIWGTHLILCLII